MAPKKNVDSRNPAQTGGEGDRQSECSFDVDSYVKQSVADRKVARGLVLDDSKKQKNADQSKPHDNLVLIQPRIRAEVLMHISHNAKQSGGLDNYHKKVLYSIGRYLKRNGGLTKKQIVLLDSLIADAKAIDMRKLACPDPGCNQCREFREYVPCVKKT